MHIHAHPSLGKAECLVQAQTEDPSLAEEFKRVRLAHRRGDGQNFAVANVFWQRLYEHV